MISVTAPRVMMNLAHQHVHKESSIVRTRDMLVPTSPPRGNIPLSIVLTSPPLPSSPYVHAYIIHKYIYNRVNDGIKDCCDGSDEPSGKFPNTCAAIAAEARAARAEQIRLYEEGAAKKKTYVKEGVLASEERLKEMASLQATKVTVDMKVEEAEKKKKAAEEKEKAEQQAVLEAKVQEFKEALKYDSLNEAQLKELYPKLKDLKGASRPETLHTNTLSLCSLLYYVYKIQYIRTHRQGDWCCAT